MSTIRVAAVQLAAEPFDRAADALDAALAAIASAARDGAELVVLPECTWPSYVLGRSWATRWPELPPIDDVTGQLADAARSAGVVLVAGLAVREGDRLFNRAMVWERDGTIAGMVDKRFLWDFDCLWFTAGTTSPVIPTSVGRLGVLVCADGRMPEVARTLAVAGAEIIVDPTAWVTTQPDPSSWTNVQYEHMLPTRAIENGLHAVAANKVGLEANGVAYCGRSCILDPDGERLATAPSDRAAIVTADCELAPPLWPTSRRPSLYGMLGRPTAELPVQRVLAGPLLPRESHRRVAVSTLSAPLDATQLDLLDALGAQLVVAPRDAGRLDQEAVLVRSADRAELFCHDVAVRTWHRTHGPHAPGDEIGPVVETPAGWLGVMIGDDGLSPETARTLMLLGADIIVWFTDEEVGPVPATRAAENRTHVVVSGTAGAVIYAPDGRSLAASGGVERLIVATIDLASSRAKEMASRTDVVLGRQPGTYGALTVDPAHVGPGPAPTIELE